MSDALLLQALQSPGQFLPAARASATEAARLLAAGDLLMREERLIPTLGALGRLPEASAEQEGVSATLILLQQLYQRRRTQRFTPGELSDLAQLAPQDLARWMAYLAEFPIYIKPSFDPETGYLSSFALSDTVLYLSLWEETPALTLASPWEMTALEIDGHRPFLRARFPLTARTGFYGPSGSGKSSLFLALRLLGDSARGALTPLLTQNHHLFTTSAPESITIGVALHCTSNETLRYEVELHGEGPTRIFRERAWAEGEGRSLTLLAVTVGRGFYAGPSGHRPLPFRTQPHQTALSLMDPALSPELSRLRTFLAQLSQAARAEEADLAGALTREIVSLSREDAPRFSLLVQWMLALWPGLFSLRVEGEGILWREEHLREEVSLFEASESALRLLWLSLRCLSEASILCLDNPDRGISPERRELIYQALQRAASEKQLLVSLDELGDFSPSFSWVRLSKESGRPLAKEVAPSLLCVQRGQDDAKE